MPVLQRQRHTATADGKGNGIDRQGCLSSKRHTDTATAYMNGSENDSGWKLSHPLLDGPRGKTVTANGKGISPYNLPHGGR